MPLCSVVVRLCSVVMRLCSVVVRWCSCVVVIYMVMVRCDGVAVRLSCNVMVW